MTYNDGIEAALNALDERLTLIGGCGDGGCLVMPPKGMHTNGGCRCMWDKYKAQKTAHAYMAFVRSIRALAPAAPEPSEAEVDMFWSKQEGLYPDETPLEDWRDELDGADPFTPVEIEVGKRMGSRWVVYIPTEESCHWHDDCHMFATEADARAALAAMGRG